MKTLMINNHILSFVTIMKTLMIINHILFDRIY